MNKTLKQVLSAFSAVSLVFGGICAVPKSSEVYAADAQSGVASLMRALNIMQGDENGDMELGRAVTRAEIAKVAISAANEKNVVGFGLKVSPFPDVTYDTWYAPYVKAAVDKGYVKGYDDFKFHPDDTVTYEEAVTVMLRVLGYTDSVIQGSYPYGQIARAEELELLDNVNGEIGQELDRGSVMNLLYNALQSDKITYSVGSVSTDVSTSGNVYNDADKQQTAVNKDTTATAANTKTSSVQSKLLSAHDCTMVKDAKIISTYDQDKEIGYNKVQTSSGTYTMGNYFDSESVGMTGKIFVKDSTDLIAFIPDGGSRTSDVYLVYSVIGDKIMAYKNSTMTSVKVSDSTTVYKGKATYTFASLKSTLDLGDKISVTKNENGDVDYITYIEGSLEGPQTAMGGNWISLWDAENASITRDGVTVSASAIQNYDVLYYLPDMNMVMAYSDKVSGIYEKATPNRDNPTTVTVSGKEYTIEGSAAFNKLYSGGEFEYGDTVTLLLGKNGGVADVSSPSYAASESIGYLVETGTKEYSSGAVNTFTNYYVKVVGTDGTAYEYITDRDYTESVNNVVEVSFSDGNARLSHINTGTTVSGTFNWKSKKLGSNKVSANVAILDIGTRDITDTSCYTKIYGQRLDGVSVDAKSVLYSHKNSDGEIDELILDNVTNDSFEYGLLTYSRDSQNSAEYKYMVSGSRYEVTVSGKYSVSTGSVVKIAGSLIRPDYMQSIESAANNITALTAEKVVVDGKTHLLSDKVSVYKYAGTGREYTMISLDDAIKNFDKYSFTVFYDKASTNGGRVRVIVVKDKK